MVKIVSLWVLLQFSKNNNRKSETEKKKPHRQNDLSKWSDLFRYCARWQQTIYSPFSTVGGYSPLFFPFTFWTFPTCHDRLTDKTNQKYLPGIWACHTCIRTAAAAFQRVTTIDDTFSGNRKMSQSIIFFLNAGIWHGSHSIKNKTHTGRIQNMKEFNTIHTYFDSQNMQNDPPTNSNDSHRQANNQNLIQKKFLLLLWCVFM